MSLGTTTHNFKARKQHRCSMCIEPINKGETYGRTKGQWEGDWQDWKAHDVCLQVYRTDEYDYSVECTSWCDLVSMTTTSNIEAFLKRFPPKDEEQYRHAKSHAEDLGVRITC